MSAEVFTLAPYSSGRRETLEHGGFSTSYWIYGQDGDTPLLLVHGFRGDHHGLEFIANALVKYGNYRVIVSDLPGFGESIETNGRTHDLDLYCGWLGSFTRVMELNHFHLVGHSFGSIITSHAVARGAVKPQTLSLLNPICEPPLAGQNRLAASGAEFYYWLGTHLPEKLGNPLLKAGIITRITSEFMAKTKDKILRRFSNRQHDLYFSAFNSRRAVMEAYATSTSHHVAEVADQLELPVLTVVGENDDLGSVPAQEKLAIDITDCQMKLIPGVGHLVHYEAPVTTAHYIHEFVKEQV